MRKKKNKSTPWTHWKGLDRLGVETPSYFSVMPTCWYGPPRNMSVKCWLPLTMKLKRVKSKNNKIVRGNTCGVSKII